jgi:hypothetical protein
MEAAEEGHGRYEVSTVVHRTSHAAGTTGIAHVSTGTATFVTEATVITGTVIAYIPIIAGAIVTYVTGITTRTLTTVVTNVSGVTARALATVVVTNRTDRAARATATGISGVCLT